MDAQLGFREVVDTSFITAFMRTNATENLEWLRSFHRTAFNRWPRPST
jgi:hypothetical protein